MAQIYLLPCPAPALTYFETIFKVICNFFFHLFINLSIVIWAILVI